MRLSKYFLFFFVELFLHKIAEKDFVMLCLLWIKKTNLFNTYKIKREKGFKNIFGFCKKRKKRIETKKFDKWLFYFIFLKKRKDQEEV